MVLYNMSLKEKLKQTPILGPTTETLWRITRPIRFSLAEFYSPDYWEARYATGGNSGTGSYGDLARFKADTINEFVARHCVTSVIEFGCGDGNQLSLSKYPRYLGLDVSLRAVKRCRELFREDASKRFLVHDARSVCSERADLVLSLDVIYHLVEDRIYEQHMRALFEEAVRFVIIYSDNVESPRDSVHVRHRRFSGWIERDRPDWRLLEHIPNKFPYRQDTKSGSWADFWIYAKEF